MAIRVFQDQFGIAIADSSTNKITVGFINQDENYTVLKTLLC